MKRLIAVVVFGVMLTSNICSAEMVYDNGASLWNGAISLSTYVGADDFELSSEVLTVNGASVDLWVNSTTFDFSSPDFGGMNWWIFGDNSGDPGAIIANGTSQNPLATHVETHSSGVEFWDLYFDLGTDVSLAANTTYWFGMGLTNTSDPISWSNSVLSGVNNAESLVAALPSFNWTHSTNGGNDLAFELHGTVVPVPGAFLLGMLGLSVAGVKLRKFS